MIHKFVNSHGDGPDLTLTKPSDWNAIHVWKNTSLSANTNIDTTTHDRILATAGAGGITLTLPTSVGNAGQSYFITKIDSAAGGVTIATTSSQTIDGITSRVLAAQYNSICVASDGSNWFSLADNEGWTFLGLATNAGTAVTIGPVVWVGNYRQLMIRYLIKGYNGGTPVGRLLLGAASISTTALTNASSLSEGVTAPTTANSIPGIPLAVTLSAIARGGWALVYGESGDIKEIDIAGHNGNPSASAAPTLFRAAGFFSDLGTNLLLQRAQLTVYDTLTATAASSNAFAANSRIMVWGKNSD